MCGLVIDHKDGHIISIKGDPDDPFSKEHICPKAIALQDRLNNPGRLKKPLLKTISGWQEISWEDALNQVSRGIKKFRKNMARMLLPFIRETPHAAGPIFRKYRFLRITCGS